MGRKATKAATLAIAVLLQLLFFTGSANAQNVTVKGKVTNEQGSPVEGASVVVKGTTNGTTTDNTGSFTISVQRNAVLVISAINFSDKEVVVTDANINVKLEPLEKSLGEVVVIGYGTQRKIDVTGAVASVNLEARRDLPMTNVGQVLQGTVPGLNVGLSTVSGGTPPISIRGRVTLSGNQNVLIILDGIQYTGSLSSINPDDIATIDVLKDASSTAVYGAQAANGVILITSKKGRKSEKPRLSFSSSYTVQQPTIGDLRPFDRDGFIKFMTENFYDKAYLAPGYTQPNPSFRLQDWIDPVLGTPTTGLQPHNYDWFDEATKNGSIYEANLSISGGSDRFTYFLSGALVDQKGYIINDNFKRKTIRANLETKPLSWWKVGVVSSASFVNQDGAEPSFGSIQRMPPLLRPYDSTGTLIPFPTRTLEPSPFTTYYVDDVERNNYYFANIYTDINFPFLKGLNYRMNFGNNYRESKRFFASIYAAGQTGQAFKNYQNYYDYTFDNILTYKNTFGKHDVTATLLYGAIERQFNSTNSRAEGFTRLNLSYNNLSLGTNRFTESSANAEALNYQMARVNYKFNDRYLLTGTIRRDGFSGFSKNFKYGVFPVVALGWVVSEEKFMKNIKAINSLKLRAGYGVNGNQTAQYTSIARVETNTSYIYGDGGTTAFGQQVSSLGNDNLEWERTAGLNIGVDFGLLKQNRLTGSLEFYKNKTTDLLYSINIPNVTGFGSIRTNVGQIDNTGFEAAINYNIIRAKDFKWDANLNFSANINKIVTIRGIDANGDGIEDDLISSGLFIGKAIGTIYDYQLDGIYQLTDTRLPGFPVGSLRIVDQNKDNDITQAADRIVLGRREPAYRVSLGNTFSYKGFSLFVFVNSVQGGKNGYLGNNNPSYFREDNTIRINDLMGIDYWSPNNPNGKYPRNVSGTRAKFEPSYWQDRSFIRLQDVTLSYNFSKLLKKLPVETISAFVSGRNLYTWTNWEGWDPETEAADANGVLQAQGLLIGGRPVLRTFTFGVNLVF
ncbi:SusC/RagA family TonB-linked outer membrane protein [Lacibacter luteus]|uniref:SusC/RagA family TonB-linked outer membrane protein n=1 Tax=Lacibacter luteus TaxID=2508719 RepID=UPI00197BB029|nr:SusC/RagA family TonB-linked outer membrane protein [Lacibacter luteus]